MYNIDEINLLIKYNMVSDYLFTYHTKLSGLKDCNSDLLRKFKLGDQNSISIILPMIEKYLLTNIFNNTLLIPIPSCNKNKINTITKITPLLCDVASHLFNGSNTLKKVFSTPSFCASGYRNIKLLKKSIRADGDITSYNILLLDDVSSTGKTFKTIASLLYELNPKSITCLSIGKTFINNIKNFKL